jgi:hypothetical protein
MSFLSDEGGSMGSDAQDPNDLKYSTAEAAANGKLYESKKIRKVVRVLTVLAYLLSVSLAAIILSMYYLFLWDPKIPTMGQGGRPMALPDPEPQRNISCFHLDVSMKTPISQLPSSTPGTINQEMSTNSTLDQFLYT